MGIDATTKYAEELSDYEGNDILLCVDEIKKTLREISEVKTFNITLLEKGISVLILGIDKSSGFSMPVLTNQLLQAETLRGIKFLVFIDSGLPIDNLYSIVWYVTGNIDPKRDCKIFEAGDAGGVSRMVVDGTRKTPEADGFRRDWPNPVVSSPETIEKVDRMWKSLGLGQYLPSPSLIYYPLKRGEGAISE
jgi:4-hydroxy-3-polyprenylbenzoate decarboxylase